MSGVLYNVQERARSDHITTHCDCHEWHHNTIPGRGHWVHGIQMPPNLSANVACHGRRVRLLPVPAPSRVGTPQCSRACGHVPAMPSQRGRRRGRRMRPMSNQQPPRPGNPRGTRGANPPAHYTCHLGGRLENRSGLSLLWVIWMYRAPINKPSYPSCLRQCWIFPCWFEPSNTANPDFHSPLI